MALVVMHFVGVFFFFLIHMGLSHTKPFLQVETEAFVSSLCLR